MEDTDDAGGHFDAVLMHAHDAECADVIVVTEHVMFLEPKSTRR